VKRLMVASAWFCLAILCSFCAHPPSPVGDVPLTGTWSDLFRDEVTGEILGVELRIVETFAGHQGALQVGREQQFGGLSGLAVVEVDAGGEMVRFVIPEPHPFAGSFEGKLQGDAIVGRFLLADGREEFVVLHRGESFWD
jgi:hypothetical protein